MDLLNFMSSFKCCKNFPLKINFSESNIFEVYAVVHYISVLVCVLLLFVCECVSLCVSLPVFISVSLCSAICVSVCMFVLFVY